MTIKEVLWTIMPGQQAFKHLGLLRPPWLTVIIGTFPGIYVCSVATLHPTLCYPMDYIAHQAPLYMGFSRQNYWNRLPFPLQGIFSPWGLNPHLLHWQVDSFTTEPPGEPLWIYMWLYFVTPCSGIRELSCNHFILEDSVGNHIA